MKNPESKPLRIVYQDPIEENPPSVDTELIALSNLAIAEATLVRAGKQSALPHFIAVVKRMEELVGWRFEVVDRKNPRGD